MTTRSFRQNLSSSDSSDDEVPSAPTSKRSVKGSSLAVSPRGLIERTDLPSDDINERLNEEIERLGLSPQKKSSKPAGIPVAKSRSGRSPSPGRLLPESPSDVEREMEAKSSGLSSTSRSTSSLTEELASAGYAVKQEIVNNGQLEYVVATSVMGDQVLIEIPQPTSSVRSRSTKTAEFTTETATIKTPTHLISAMTCANSAVCGVSAECSGDRCVLTKGSQSDNRTVTLRKKSTNKSVEEVANFDDSGVPIPVVKLASVKSDPLETAKSIRDSSVKIKNMYLEKINQEIAMTEDYLRKTQERLMGLKNLLREHDTAVNRNRLDYSALLRNFEMRRSKGTLSAEQQSAEKVVSSKLSQISDYNRSALESIAHSAKSFRKSVESASATIKDTMLSVYLESKKSLDSSAGSIPAIAVKLPLEYNSKSFEEIKAASALPLEGSRSLTEQSLIRLASASTDISEEQRILKSQDIKSLRSVV